VSTAQNTVVNIEDQYRQRGRHALTDDELVRKRASGKELISELKRGTAERGVNVSVVIAAAAADAQTLNNAVESVIRTQRRNNIGSKRWKGSQPTLWQAFNPGTEQAARLGEFRNPTTTGRFAKFVPLLTNKLGNNTGVPLGMSVTSPGLRDVVLEDLLNAPARENPMNIVLVGSPGAKVPVRQESDPVMAGIGRGYAFVRSNRCTRTRSALNDFENKIVIDIQRMNFSLDGLRVFPYQEAAEKTIDHLLPQLGFSPLTRQAKRLAGLLSPESRQARGIGSTMGLIRYLRDLPAAERTSADEDLLIGLEGLSSERLLRPLFDETLPTPDLASTQCVIWNFAGLDLPTVTEEYVAHLHQQTTPCQRAAQALWGLGADLAVSIFFARPGQPDMLVVEECAPWAHSPGGQKTANKVITQGRKAWTGFAGISQQPIKDIKETLKHEFIDQRVCFGFKDAELARATLQWCGRDLNRHPDLLTNYVSNTGQFSSSITVTTGSTPATARSSRAAKAKRGSSTSSAASASSARLSAHRRAAQRHDTNPHRNRRRNQARSA
jgi:hypothetical protein